MSFEVTGRLHKKFDTEKKTESFQAREFVIEVDGQYQVHFDLRGREWQGKYFTNLNAWRVEAGTAAVAEGAPPPAAEGAFPTLSDAPASVEDDLPF